MAWSNFGKNASLLVVAAVVLTAPIAAAKTYAPDFKQLGKEWPVKHPDKVFVSDKKLTIECKDRNRGVMNTDLRFPDMTLTVDTMFTPAETKDSQVMILFAAKDFNNTYAFCLNPRGQYHVEKMDNANIKHVTEWANSKAIKPTSGWNTVKLEIKGRHGTAYANGQSLGGFAVEVPGGGGNVGFEVVKGTGKFQNLVVNY